MDILELKKIFGSMPVDQLAKSQSVKNNTTKIIVLVVFAAAASGIAYHYYSKNQELKRKYSKCNLFRELEK